MKAPYLILAADDDDDDLYLLRSALSSSGTAATLKTFSNGVDLLAYLNDLETLPALVLLDINMPRMDGFQALQQIRKNDRHRVLPVILMTTSREAADVNRGYALGANAYVPKPYQFAEMTEMMRLLSTFWLETARLPFHVSVLA